MSFSINNLIRRCLDKENRSHRIAAAVTVALMGLLILLCCSIVMYAPDPPIPEEGVEVALGYDEAGQGDNSTAASAPNYANPSSVGQYATQSTEQSVAMPDDSRGTKTNPNATTNDKVDNPEPQINDKAIFKGRTNPNKGQSGQGNTGGDGQQGSPNGTPGSSNFSGNGGPGYSLKGRSAVALPSPVYNSDKQGKVVVKVWVDRQGNVTNVSAPEQGSTIHDEQLVKNAKLAARNAKFNASPNAAEQQTGTITYVFIRSN